MTDYSNNTARAPWQSTASLIAGVASLVALIIFFVLPAGASPLLFAALLGVIAIVLGIIGVRGSRPKGMAVTGIVIGAIVLLISAGIYMFALLFIGAFSA